MTSPHLSLILTAYNDADILAASLPAIAAFFTRTTVSYELIIVDDGSTRPASLAALEHIRRNYPAATVAALSQNRGRGAAVKEGLRLARGTYAGFIDNDLEIPIHYVLPLLLLLEAGHDVAIARRIYTLAPRNAVRYVFTKGYHWLVNTVLDLPGYDTETGCKLFNRAKILPLLAHTPNDRWFWDTEIIFAAHQAGLRLVELPSALNKRHDVPTSVNFIPAIIAYLRDLYCLWRRTRRKQSPQPQQQH